MVNKKLLVSMIAEETGFTKKESRVVLESIVASIREALQAGEKVTISGFGTFKVKETSARIARNPRTGESVAVPAGKKPVFVASKTLKEVVKPD